MASETVAFLPSVQESIMDELRTTEGMIFRDEGTKKFFIDLKCFVLEALSGAWKSFDAETYRVVLDSYVTWDKVVAAKELARAALPSHADIGERLTPVTVLYAKYIYARSAPDASISIRKPRLESLLKGMFTRLARSHHVRNGTFYDFDPLRQDFVVRDIFRQTLGSDCIEIAEDFKPVAEAVEDDEVYPDDSISMVMQRLLPQESAQPATAQPAKTHPAMAQPANAQPANAQPLQTLQEEAHVLQAQELTEPMPQGPQQAPQLASQLSPQIPQQVLEQESLIRQIAQDAAEAAAADSVLSRASKATRASQFRAPTLVRRVVIEGDE